jgi:hypothetical protein
MAPRKLISMIDEWHGIEENRAQLAAYLNQGGKLPEKETGNAEYFEIHPDAF